MTGIDSSNLVFLCKNVCDSPKVLCRRHSPHNKSYVSLSFICVLRDMRFSARLIMIVNLNAQLIMTIDNDQKCLFLYNLIIKRNWICLTGCFSFPVLVDLTTSKRAEGKIQLFLLYHWYRWSLGGRWGEMSLRVSSGENH